MTTGKPAEALASYEAALAIRQKLADANPAVTEFQAHLAMSHTNIGILLKETGKPAEALASFKAALAIQQRLADANPTVTEFQIDLANTHLETGDVLRLTGQPAEARASYERALAIIEQADQGPTGLRRLPSGLPGLRPEGPRGHPAGRRPGRRRGGELAAGLAT